MKENLKLNLNNIKEMFNNKPSIMREAENGRYHPIWILQVLIFILVFVITQIVSSIPLVFLILTNKGLTENDLALPMLFLTIFTALLVIVYCRFIERRSIRSMGLVKEKIRSDYLVGILVGFVMFSACVIIAYMAGTLEFNGYVLGNGIGILVLFFIGFIIQGAEEEVMMRGYVMMSMGARYSVLTAVITNSVLFAALHLGNNGVTKLAFINLVLYGAFASVYTLKMDSLWGICAIHTVWNFAQGNIYGISVSGLDMTTSIFSFGLTKEGALINGGTFGLEGGLAVTIVLIISIIIVSMLKGRNISMNGKNIIKEQEEITSGIVAE